MLIWMGASWTVAEDAVQEAFSDLMRKWDTVKMPSPWLRQATKTHFFKILRRNRKAQQREHRPAGEDDYEVPDPSAEAALLVWEDQEWIDQLMRQLSPSARETLELILQDYSRAEIGALMGKTENAVRQNLHNARKQLEQLRGPDYTINGRTGPARTRGEAE